MASLDKLLQQLQQIKPAVDADKNAVAQLNKVIAELVTLSTQIKGTNLGVFRAGMKKDVEVSQPFGVSTLSQDVRQQKTELTKLLGGSGAISAADVTKITSSLTRLGEVYRALLNLSNLTYKAVGTPVYPAPGGGGARGGVPPINPPIPPMPPGAVSPGSPQAYYQGDVAAAAQLKNKLIALRAKLILELGDIQKADQVIQNIKQEIVSMLRTGPGFASGVGGIRINAVDVTNLRDLGKGRFAYTPRYGVDIRGEGADVLSSQIPMKGRYLTNQGVEYSLPVDKPKEYTVQQKVGFALQQSQGFTAAANKVERDIQRQIDMYKKLGVVQVETTTSARKLANGTVAVSTTFTDGEQALGRTTEYLQKAARGYKVLTDAQYNLVKGSQLSQKQISNLATITPQTFGKAGKYGFGQDDLRKAALDAASGMTRYTFQKYDDQGVLRSLTITTNKFGEAVVDTSRRFRGFIDGIRRDMVEFTKWGISAAIVYGSFQKINEIIQLAISNESKLADITIALGDAQKSTNEIFAEAAQVAQQTGEHIDGVLEGYTLAYRSTGTLTDQEDRFIATNKILTDSLILSKLSGMEQAAAMDALAGALRQTQKEGESASDMFGRGRDLIDQWVVVTRNANVDLQTLAMSFSITAESALGAGMSIEQLNAVVAVLAEKTGGLGAKETGNAVRAIVGGLYQPGAAEELTKYGIAVTDTEGKARSFLDVMNQINSLRNQQLISEDQLNKIAYVLGGGVRRGQQYVAVLGDIGRVNDLVAVQANSHGAAEQALSIKLETVQTSVTRLGNSFQILAQSLGSENGALNLIRDLLNLVSGLVEGLAKLSGALGQGGLSLIGLAAGLAAFGGKGLTASGRRQGIIDYLSGTGAAIGGFLMGEKAPTTPIGTGRPSLYPGLGGLGGQYPGRAAGGAVGSFLGKWGGGILGVGLPTALNLQEGNLAGAGANIAGGIVGALVGGPVGAILGSMIAEAFVKGIKDKADTKYGLYDFLPKEKPTTTETTATPQTTKEQIIEQLNKLIPEAFSSGLVSKRPLPGLVEGEGGYYAKGSVGAGNVTAWVESIFAGGKNLTEEQKMAQVMMNSPEIKNNKQIQDLLSRLQAMATQEQLPVNERGVFSDFNKKYGEFISNYMDEQNKKLLDDLISGKVSAKEYRTGTGLIPKLPASVSQIYAAGGKQFDEAIQGIAGDKQTIQAIMDILINSPQEATDRIVILSSAINDLQDRIAKSANGYVAWGDGTLTVAEAQAELNKYLAEFTPLLQSSYLELQKTLLILPKIIESEDLSLNQITQTVEQARRAQRVEFEATKPGGDYEAYMKQFEEFFVRYGQQQYTKVAPGLNPEYYTAEVQRQQEAGKLGGSNLSFAAWDKREQERYQMALQTYQSASFQALLSNMGYSLKETPQIVMFEDGTLNRLTKDWKIMNLLMQQIVDNTADTVEGIYNLPANGSFYVPFTAQLQNQMRGGGAGGLTNLIPPTLGTVEGEGTTTYSSMAAIPQNIRSLLNFEPFTTPTTAPTPQTPAPVLSSFAGSISGVDAGKFREEIRTIEEIMKSTHYYPYTLPSAQPTVQQKQYPLLGDMSGVSGSALGGLDMNALKSIFTTAFANIKQKLDLKFSLTSTATLLVDGRQMANVVKKYLYDDLVTNDTTISSTI